MIRPLKVLLSLIGLALIIFCGWFFSSKKVISSIAAPSYSVFYKASNFEVRTYAPYIIAETMVEGDFETALEKGRAILDEYVAGHNASSTKITDKFLPLREMVTGQLGNTHLISYIFPASLTLKDLPAPATKDIRLYTISKQKVAVLSFSGNPSAAHIAQRKSDLTKILTANQTVMFSEPAYVRYTPTNILPFLIRNEVQVEI